MRTTADGILTIEGDLLSVGIPREAGLPLGLLLVFFVSPLMTALSVLVILLVAPQSVSSVALSLLFAGALVLGPGALGVVHLLLCLRGGRRHEVRIDLGEWLIERPGASAQPLRRPEQIRMNRAGFGWRLSMDDERLLDGPYFAGASLRRAAMELAEAMGSELSVPAAAERARLPMSTRPNLLAAVAYLPFDPVAVPLSIWILAARDTEAEGFRAARFAAAQSLASFVVELGLATAMFAVLALPLWLLGTFVSVPLSVAALLCPLFTCLLLRTALRGYLALRAGAGEVTVIFGLRWWVGRWAPRKAARSMADKAPPPVVVRPTSVARSAAGGLGPWWT